MCTGFPDQTRQLLQQLIVDLDGSCLTDCYTGTRIDVLVACSVLSSKYKVLAAISCRASQSSKSDHANGQTV